MVEKEKLQELLQKLVHAIYSTINEGLANGMLQPQYEPYFRWKLKEYEYGNTGIAKKSAEGKEFLRPYWGRATRDVHQRASKLSVYNDILEAISKGYKINGVQLGYSLPTFTERVAWNILEGKIKSLHDCDKYIILFLKDLCGEEQEHRAEVQLRGLVLQPRSIKLDDNTKVRKPDRKDFEREEPSSYQAFRARRLEDPTAFLHTRIYATGVGVPLQNEIDREVAVLRLYRVGAVQDIRYSMDSDSIIGFGAGTLTRGKLLGSDKYLVAREDVKSLKTFWANMKKIELPNSVYPGNQKEADELSIAYERYNDSLEGGVIEKRISSAVMGLEALYLYPSEQQEMSYRLRMRIAKLLGLIGCNPNEVRKKLTDAYNIRSTYVHGGILKQTDRRKYERKYGDLNEFSKTIMDYLRASIVTLLRRPGKKTLIEKIDDSFLDTSKEEEIRKLLFMPYEREVF